MTTAFDSWVSKQIEEGLVDIKFAVVAGKGVSVEAIQNELLAAEAALSAGYTRHPPTATSEVPEAVAKFVAEH